MAEKIRVLIVDDHALLREGIRTLLSTSDDIQVVGEAADGAEAVEKARLLAPEVVLMDLAMPEVDGIEATRRLIRENPQIKVLAMTQYDHREYVLSIVKAGAVGFIPKKAAAGELLNAIKTVHQGDSFLYPSIARTVIDDYLRDKLSKPITGKEAERLGLVDKNGWYEDAKNISENNTKTDNITRRLNRSEWDTEWGTEEQIAIIGVYGTIKPGESEPPATVILPIPYIGGGRSTGSETVVRQLEDAFANSKVKVIILRVDSGGGSALASAEINEAIIRLKRKYKKPLIVSMGNAAASGGYLVSVSADKIFSDDLTITGSIGVWASRPNLDSLIKGQKIKVEIFKRGENSDIGSFFRKLDEEDVEIIQGIIDFYYGRFIDAISEGRKISRQEAEEIAQGRIWMGSDAFNKKLVDEIGGLYQAVIYAKKISGIDKRHKIVYYAVPGGSTINEIVSKSIAEYIQSTLLDMLGFDEEEPGLEIKY